MYERLQGKPPVALASIFQHSPSVLLVRKDSGIRSPQDLIGRNVMVIGNETDADLLAMMRNEGVELSKINLQKSSYDINDLLNGKTDAFNSYLTNQPYFMIEKGVAVSVINPINYGIDFYTDVLFTTEDEIRNNPERVKKFRAASLRGWEYAMKNPSEIIDLIQTKYGGAKTRAHLEFEAQAMEKLILPTLIEIGHMNPGRWKHMAKTFKNEGMVRSTTRLDGFLYDPDPPEDVEKWRNLVVVPISIVIVLGGIAVSVIYFNARLKREVDARTAELSESVEKERRANRVKSDLMSNMSHELRTPLNTVIGFSNIMTQGTAGELGDKHKEYAEGIHSSGEHLLELIDDILDVSDIEDDKIKLSEAILDIAGVADAAIESVRLRACGSYLRTRLIFARTSANASFIAMVSPRSAASTPSCNFCCNSPSVRTVTRSGAPSVLSGAFGDCTVAVRIVMSKFYPIVGNNTILKKEYCPATLLSTLPLVRISRVGTRPASTPRLKPFQPSPRRNRFSHH